MAANATTIGAARNASASSSDFIARARAIRGLIESEADNAERNGTVSLNVVEAMREAQLFWTLCPRELGGAEESILTHMDVLEEVASADASTGWTLMANATATTVAATQCSDAHVARMFGGSRLPVMSLAFAPTGRALPTDDKYKVGGRFGFGSGIAHADWVSGGLMVMDGNAPQMLPNGMPKVVGAFVPRSEVRLHGNWDVTGLQGTGSYDFEISEQVVPQDWTFNQYFTDAHRGGAIAKMGTYAYATGGHTAVVLGIARRALQEIAGLASKRKRLGSSEMIADNSVFRLEFMRHEALYQAARALVHQVYSAAEETARNGNPVSAVEMARIRQAATWGHQVAKEVVLFAFGAGASASIRNPSVLGRLLRDITVAAQHIIVDPQTLVDAAPEVIKSWVEARA
jgi:indole-3-acetate monooxygenase